MDGIAHESRADLTPVSEGYRWAMLLYLFLINLILNGVILMIVPPLFPGIADELGLNYAHIGSLWGSSALGLILFSLIGGVAADRFGVKKILSIAIAIVCLFAGLRGLVHTYVTLWLCFFFMGVGLGFILPNLPKCIAMWFGSAELSRANGISIMGVSIGMGIGVTIGVPLRSVLGSWQTVMFFSGLISFALWGLWVLAAREGNHLNRATEITHAQPRSLQGLRKVFTIKDVWLIGFIELFFIGNHMTLLGIVPTFLVHKGMEEAQAGFFTSVSNWTSLAGLIIGPYISDRIGLRKIVTWPWLLILAALTISVAHTSGWLQYCVWGLFGLGFGWVLPQLRSIIAELEEIGPVLSGSAFGGIFTFNRIGCFALPWLMGIVITATGVEEMGFYFLAGASLIPPILMLFVRETGRRAVSSASEI
jgi:MFS family permease